jgi:hypothetical protein
MEPLISVALRDGKRVYHPGDTLVCEYQIDGVARDEIQAVEASVLWHTEGKGDEDLGVHYFERHTVGEVNGGDLRSLRRLETRLPNSPLSYSGIVVKIRWCVRVRLFLRRGRDAVVQHPFQLGDVPAVVVAEPDDDTKQGNGAKPADRVRQANAATED